jgi:hypothetical protein
MMIGILKKHSRAVIVAYPAILHRIHHPSVLHRIWPSSRYFVAYLTSVMLLHA